ncbi:MAG: lipid A biosynthesis acyltransferase [Acidiferrobacteraceae bacterium]|nr:lipid A biosynthesis acyltransferase [Acidiferrobacteraceae bacterium]|tara:strand:+ start:1242 stop:2183 length:942 start_codon:yes stop_codon:yes gene_type:complete
MKTKYWTSWLLVPLLWIFSYLPVAWSHKIGGALGAIIYRIASVRREIAIRNLELCFPEKDEQDIRAIAKNTFRNIAKATLTSGIGWWSSKKRLKRLVRIKHSEHYDGALKSDQNIILLAPHFVALEIGGIYLSIFNSITSVYQHSRNPVFNKLMVRGRRRFGLMLVERKNGLMPLVRNIVRGSALYYLPDQDPGLQWNSRGAVFAPFFGVTAATWATLGRLAKLTDATVIPCATKILQDGQGFEIIFRPPLDNFPTGNPIIDAETMNHAIEELVREMPDQYFWVHRRFKTQPIEQSGNPYINPRAQRLDKQQN